MKTLITFENHKEYIGKKVEIKFTSRKDIMGGASENEILSGMKEGDYYFTTDKGTENQRHWVWFTDTRLREGHSIEVFYNGDEALEQTINSYNLLDDKTKREFINKINIK